MSGKRILVIDDSATIRRLADNALSQAGYQVLLASTAEEGLRTAAERPPDLILLDHQLPGTTGQHVCEQLLQQDELSRIPVVVSSTLRKRAYMQYADMPNVVDMLPKPYTAELLTTTVANALDTASLVVHSQVEGTAVPETMHEVGEGDLCGVFRNFHVREVLDFLNNAAKSGTLELHAANTRISVYLSEGRVQGVSATGIEPEQVMRNLPEALQSLAPVLKHTLRGRSCAEIDGLVELLDRKVVDARLLRRLLQHQAAVLMFTAFTEPLRDFRFDAQQAPPPLHTKLPINSSVLALLIEGAVAADATRLPEADDDVFVRAAVRGQNLDRAGVSAQHLKLLNILTQPHTLDDVAAASQLPHDEAQRVLTALCLAQLVEKQRRGSVRQVVIFESDQQAAQHLKATLQVPDRYVVKVVRDRLALQLVLRRSRPDLLMLALDPAALAWTRELCEQLAAAGHTRLVGIVVDERQRDELFHGEHEPALRLHAVLVRPLEGHKLVAAWDRLFDGHAGKDSPAENGNHDDSDVWSAVAAESKASHD